MLARAQRVLGSHHHYVQLMGADSFLSLTTMPEAFEQSLSLRDIAVFLRAGTDSARVIQAAAKARGRLTLSVARDRTGDAMVASLRKHSPQEPFRLSRNSTALRAA